MGFLEIHTAHPVITGSTVTVTIRGTVTTENVNDLQYHIEAVYFLHGPCDVHVDLAGMTVDVADQTWIDRLAAAARTARLRRGRLSVCRPPLRNAPTITAAGVVCCDETDHATAPEPARARPRTRTG